VGRDLHIYEIDHRATQDDKRRRLQLAGISIPPNLEFVAIDFELISLHEGPRASTLNFAEPTFFSCLGVLVYLTQEAANAVFKVAAGFPAGSEIVFTFSTPDASLTADDRQNRAALAAMARSAGEPWQTHFEQEKLMHDLIALGFSVNFLSAEEADQTYFQGRTDGLRAPRRGGICAAVVENH
jgi:methyltransferase (TIGR00027 family)